MPPSPHDHYHSPGSVEELTEQNVKTIAQLERATERQASSTDRAAGKITAFCGSMPFVWMHVIWFAIWIVLNTMSPWKIDPYPFSFLTLVVSLEAIFLSTFIMISENRQERIDQRRSHLDLQINLLAEQESTKALELLRQIALTLGLNPSGDPAVAVLEKATRPEKLIEQIDKSIAPGEKEDTGKT